MSKARELSQLGDAVTVDAGNLGIGTAVPNSAIHVEKTSAPRIRSTYTGGANLDMVAGATSGYFGTQSNHGLALFTNDVTRMTIEADGTVVIPDADINGGTIDGTVIGATGPQSATFAQVTVKSSNVEMFKIAPIALTQNNGNLVDYDLPGALSSLSAGSATMAWIVSMRGFGDATNGFSAVYLITWFGSAVAGMSATAIQPIVQTGGSVSLALSRVDPGSNAAHKLRVQTNNYGTVRTITAVRLV
jgi:hypothetical protein